MPVLCLILEWRYFDLRSRSTRVWAYTLVLSSKAILPLFVGLTMAGADPYGDVLLLALLAFLFPLFSWPIVLFLCFFKDHSSQILYRLLPAGFAPLGMEDSFYALGPLMFI
jgi:hypothetical protein